MDKMIKLRKGVWWSATAVELKQYKATSGEDVYFIWAENKEQAITKAQEWRKSFNIDSTHI